jgi:hypothetical protein
MHLGEVGRWRGGGLSNISGAGVGTKSRPSPLGQWGSVQNELQLVGYQLVVRHIYLTGL